MSAHRHQCPSCGRVIKWALRFCTDCTRDKFIEVRGERMYAEYRLATVVKKERVFV